MRQTFAEVSLPKLINNYLKIRNLVKPSKIMAIVKADAYGHGAVKIAETLRDTAEGGPEYYGVSILAEAIELRENGIDRPILLLEPIDESLLHDAKKYDVTVSVNSLEQIQLLKTFQSDRALSGLKIHIKIDTGMNRLGIRWDECFPALFDLLECSNYLFEGIYTHFAKADEKDLGFSRIQLKRFTEILEVIDKKGFSFSEIHAANSSATLQIPESYFTMVRPGLSLYGYYPSQEIEKVLDLEPILCIYTKIELVKKILKGEGTSYGLTHLAETDKLISTLPIGYADGYDRMLSNKARVIIANKEYSQIGAVTMDRIIIDLNNIVPQKNEKVILLGSSVDCKFDAWDWAKICNGVPYTVLCTLSKRLPRIYVEN